MPPQPPVSAPRAGPFRSRLVRFVVSGGGAAALFFVLSYLFMKGGLPPFAGTVTAYAIAFVAAYLAQRIWTFEARHAHSHALPRYLVLQVVCAVSAGLVAHVARGWGVPPLAVSLATTLAAGAVSYVVSSRWVFPDGPERSQ